MARRLTDYNVAQLYEQCVATGSQGVWVDCLGRRSYLHPQVIEAIKPQIEAMLYQLPIKFHSGGGQAKEARMDHDGFVYR